MSIPQFPSLSFSLSPFFPLTLSPFLFPSFSPTHSPCLIFLLILDKTVVIDVSNKLYKWYNCWLLHKPWRAVCSYAEGGWEQRGWWGGRRWLRCETWSTSVPTGQEEKLSFEQKSKVRDGFIVKLKGHLLQNSLQTFIFHPLQFRPLFILMCMFIHISSRSVLFINSIQTSITVLLNYSMVTLWNLLNTEMCLQTQPWSQQYELTALREV